MGTQENMRFTIVAALVLFAAMAHGLTNVGLNVYETSGCTGTPVFHTTLTASTTGVCHDLSSIVPGGPPGSANLTISGDSVIVQVCAANHCPAGLCAGACVFKPGSCLSQQGVYISLTIEPSLNKAEPLPFFAYLAESAKKQA